MGQITEAVGTCCLALSLMFGNNTIWYPGTSTYAASLASYYAVQQTAIHPRCIITPRSADEVSAVIRVLNHAPATDPSCQFAVRGGGHATYAGASNIGDGVTIDLQGLHDITLQHDTGIVSIGAGATWGDVYSYLDPLNKSVAGGRDSSVGVAGLTIGGGISYFGPRYGWACNTVRNFEVVLANGSIVNANATENPGLLRALRGGAGNFGIVTRVDMQTFTQGNLWGGTIIHDMSTTDAEITALARFSYTDEYDEYSSLISTFAYNAGQAVIVNTLQYTKDVAGPPVFQPFLQMPSLTSTLGSDNMTALATRTGVMQVQGEREGYATVTIRPTHAALDATVRAWNSSVGSVRHVEGIVWALNFEPLPASFYSRDASVNALGFDHGDSGPLMVVLLSVTWSRAEDDRVVEDAMKGLVRAMQQDAARLGALHPYLYLNYAAAWQDPIASYGGTSVAMLSRTQREFDRQMTLATRKPGGFKIHSG